MVAFKQLFQPTAQKTLFNFTRLERKVEDCDIQDLFIRN